MDQLVSLPQQLHFAGISFLRDVLIAKNWLAVRHRKSEENSFVAFSWKIILPY